MSRPRGVAPGAHEGPVPFLRRPLHLVVGKRTADVLGSALGLSTVGDLVRHFPRRYVERGEFTLLSELREGDDATVMATVKSVTGIPMRQRRGGQLVKVVISDGIQEADVAFFAPKPHLAEYYKRQFRIGQRVMFSGKVGSFRGRLQLTHPDSRVLEGGEQRDGLEQERAEAFAEEITPIYPASAKITSWRIASTIRLVLDDPALMSLEDPVPQAIRERHDLMPFAAALFELHRPTSLEAVAEAQRRMRYEEAFLLQVALAGRRAEVAAQPAVPRAGGAGLLASFDERMPFTLTAGQRRVGEEIRRDLAREHPMHRLLQGEVGSGKTVVALRAMLTVVDSGGQAALLAPTEVLAQQHFRSISLMLGDLAEGGLLMGHADGTQVRLLTGSQSAAVRREALEAVESGVAGIVVGTHALLQDRVEFDDLGLVVVDEQHRFGVEQRDALRAKAERPPHVLVMTATPIPRTVAMTVFGDLETSVLRELPAGRQPIATHLVHGDRDRWMRRTWEVVREQVAAGHQAYVVCARIGPAPGDAEGPEGDGPEGDGTEGERAQAEEPEAWAEGVLPAPDPNEGPRPPAAAALDTLAALRAEPALAGLRIEVLHGRLGVEDKDAVMADFASGAVDVLVATTVVEVGVDVPNATAMVVLDADRFGVSQLHQLRGRIGRGSAPGVCFLVTGVGEGTPAWERLSAVRETVDGFRLAEVDLEHRREGDVLGAAQSGRQSSLRLLRVLADADLIAVARDDAIEVVDSDPVLVSYPALLDALFERLDADQLDFLERG